MSFHSAFFRGRAPKSILQTNALSELDITEYFPSEVWLWGMPSKANYLRATKSIS